MGRPRGFIREEVLDKAIALFWEKGFADTSLQDLEQATGVNKSGLYAEFANKEQLFLASLRQYLDNRGGEEILATRPRGWDNIQRFLEIGQTCYTGRRGCFSVNSMRDVALLPPEGRRIIEEKNVVLRRLIIANIRAERPDASAAALADLVLTFFSGLCIEENLDPAAASVRRRIAGFMQFLRAAP